MNIKLLRRAGLELRQGSVGGSTAASSSAPSKATSDAGQETTSEEGVLSPSDGTPHKDKSKLTREEREAQYKAARDRIFGPESQETAPSESASTGENSASMSRSSSSSGKRKVRKAKTPKDDSFEARSAFIQSYNPIHIPSAHQYQHQFPEQGYQGPYQSPLGVGHNINYGTTPTQSFPGHEASIHFNGYPGYPPSNGPQAFSPSDSWSSAQTVSSSGYFPYSQNNNNYQQNVPQMSNQLNGPYTQQAHATMQHSQGWNNNQYQQYPQQGQQGSPNMGSWANYQNVATMPNSQTYGYGNMPLQTYPSSNNYNTQQTPLPGNFARSLFNPQTRSFVPNNANSRTGGRNGRKKPSPPSSQSRINTISKPFGIDALSVGTSPQPPRSFASNSSSPKPKEDSLQQKYGAPAHLPKKPPPSQVTSTFDVESIINNAASSKTGPLVVNGGNSGPS